MSAHQSVRLFIPAFVHWSACQSVRFVRSVRSPIRSFVVHVFLGSSIVGSSPRNLVSPRFGLTPSWFRSSGCRYVSSRPCRHVRRFVGGRCLSYCPLALSSLSLCTWFERILIIGSTASLVSLLSTHRLLGLRRTGLSVRLSVCMYMRMHTYDPVSGLSDGIVARIERS